ncbi:MAG: hypothetical protein V1709_08645 [Planctomycetota bacterium]
MADLKPVNLVEMTLAKRGITRQIQFPSMIIRQGKIIKRAEPYERRIAGDFDDIVNKGVNSILYQNIQNLKTNQSNINTAALELGDDVKEERTFDTFKDTGDSTKAARENHGHGNRAEEDPIFSAWLIATPPIYEETDPVFSAWLIATPPAYESELVNYVPYTGAISDVDLGVYELLCGGVIFTGNWPKVHQITDVAYNDNLAWLLPAASGTFALQEWVSAQGYLTAETDPVFIAWDKSTGISITESQISDLQAYLTVETDPIVGAIDGIVKADGAGNISSADSLIDFINYESAKVYIGRIAVGGLPTLGAYSIDPTAPSTIKLCTQVAPPIYEDRILTGAVTDLRVVFKDDGYGVQIEWDGASWTLSQDQEYFVGIMDDNPIATLGVYHVRTSVPAIIEISLDGLIANRALAAVPPDEGVLFYDTITNCLFKWDGLAWVNISSNWDAAYTHKTTEDAITGLVSCDGAGNYSGVTNNSSNWDTAYGWGDHAGLYDTIGTGQGIMDTHELAYDHTLIATALQSESDPVFLAWDKTTGISITESQISDLQAYALASDLADYVAKSLYDVDSILYATTDNTPVALTINEQRLVGRLTGGHIIGVTIGIADDNIIQVDQADAADNDYAKFTADGLEGRSYSEVKTDLSLNNVDNTSDANKPVSTAQQVAIEDVRWEMVLCQ